MSREGSLPKTIDLHAALMAEGWAGQPISLRKFQRLVMEAKEVTTLQSVGNELEAMELLELIAWTKGESVKVLAPAEPHPDTEEPFLLA